jgi:hypothetical protein
VTAGSNQRSSGTRIRLQYVAGCEASLRLVNFVDAYDARILAYISD